MENSLAAEMDLLKAVESEEEIDEENIKNHLTDNGFNNGSNNGTIEIIMEQTLEQTPEQTLEQTPEQNIKNEDEKDENNENLSWQEIENRCLLFRERNFEINNAKEEFFDNCLIVWDSFPFQLSESFLGYLFSIKDQKNAIVLDVNNYPRKIANVKNFYEHCTALYNSVILKYYAKIEKLNQELKNSMAKKPSIKLDI